MTSGSATGLRFARMIYRGMLVFFPAKYRQQNGPELVSFFEDGYRDAVTHQGWLGAVRCLLRAAVDAIVHGSAERWSASRRSTSKKTKPRHLREDIRYALRSMRKAPLFTAVTVATIGLGVGANSAIFSVVKSVLLDPLPYDEADRLVTVWEANTARDRARMQVSYPNYGEWVDGQSSFEGMAAVATQSALLLGRNGDESRRIAITAVSPGLFHILRSSPLLGRTFRADDASPSAVNVTILSAPFWQRHFGGDPEVIGKTVDFLGASLIVVGVMPPDFAFPNPTTEMWVPLGASGGSWEIRSAHMVNVVARLKPNVTINAAEREMVALAASIEANYPGEDPAHSAMVVPLNEVQVEDVKSGILLLFGAVAVILLIASVNVANLILAQSVSRQREMAVRAAIGASPGRLIRQLLTEGVLLAGFGALVGAGVAWLAVQFVVPLVPDTLPRADGIAVDGGVLLFTLVVAVVTGLAFSLVPAFHATAVDPALQLNHGQRGTDGLTPLRVRRTLVVAEIALSSVLLVVAGLFIGSFWRVLRVEPGFDPTNLATMTVSLFAETTDDVKSFYRNLPREIEAIPGVEAAGAVNTLPVNGADSHGAITVEGVTFEKGTEPAASYRRIVPGYFAAMGIPVLNGRDFHERDDATGDFVTIVSASMARRFWPNESPVGKRIKVGPAENEPWLTVIGVVGDVHNQGLDITPGFSTYEPHSQRPWSTMNVVIRSVGDAALVTRAVQRRILELHPNVAVYGTNTMQRRIRDSFASRRFHMVLLGSFASVALSLAVVGIYGVVSYTVTARRHEIGIRMALGASGGRVRRGVVRDAATLAGIGVTIGVGLSLLLGGMLRPFVFDARVVDPITFAVVAALLVGVALIASGVPASKATGVKPMDVFRK